MKLLKALGAIITLALLGACDSSDDVENIVGRWSIDKGAYVMDISQVSGNDVRIDVTTRDINRRLDEYSYNGTFSDNLLVMTDGSAEIEIPYNAELDRFEGIATYVRVPEGWMWGNGAATQHIITK
jgi:hypothetical protein